MSAVAAAAREAAAPPDALQVYRDDGVIAGAIGRAVGPRVPAPGAALATAGAVVLIAAVALRGDGASEALAGAVLAVLLVLCGASAGRRDPARVRWLTPPLLRFVEYAGLVWIASIDGPSAVPAAFAMLCAAAFRHYDLVYRLRHRAETPPAWVNAAGLGWDGRLLAGYAALLAGALPAALFVLAAVLGAVFVAESATGWVRWSRAQGSVETKSYEDEEDEVQ